jgi:hypothetical protein
MSVANARRFVPANETPRENETNDRVARFRPGELHRLMKIRGWRTLPVDDNGTRFAARMLDTLALSGNASRQRAANFLELRCPWMATADRANAIEAAFTARRVWSAEALGTDLDVTEAERKLAKIKTFRPANMTDAAMKAKQRKDEAERGRKRRRQNRLHPKQTLPLPALRAAIILDVLTEADGWVDVSAICAELRFAKKTIHFAGLTGKDLTAAVHRAIQYGMNERTIEKQVLLGATTKIAQIRKRGPT